MKPEPNDFPVISSLHSACLTCVLNKQLTNIPEGVPEDVRLRYVRGVIAICAAAPDTYSGPVLMQRIARLQRELLGGTTVDYTAKRAFYNRMMLDREPEMRERVRAAADPLLAAVQYALTGNYIDFGGQAGVRDDELEKLLRTATAREVDMACYRRMRTDLAHCRKLVYLTDNCGEIVADKILLGEISHIAPQADLTVIVRGGEVFNDATEADAAQVGLTSTYRVIGNGNDIGGTFLPEISPEACAELRDADIIISKGMGNCETLMGCGLNIYYMFLCKCALFTARFHRARLDAVLTAERTESPVTDRQSRE